VSARVSSLLATSTAASALLAYLWKWPCRFGGAWNHGIQQFTSFCYTDIYPLWFHERLHRGAVPYFDHPVEYPVGIGGVMEACRRGAWSADDRAVAFYDLTVVVLAACWIAGVLLLARLAGPTRRWDALWFALAPAMIFTAYINWDLVAGVLVLGFFVAWSARQHVVAGVLLGLAIATKFYPVVFLGPLCVLALRTGAWRSVARTVAGAAIAWLAVNLPLIVLALDGWKHFYVFSAERGADWGSIWYFFQSADWPLLGDPRALDVLAVSLLGALCVGIAVLALAAPRRPRLAQLSFLALAAFVVSNKVWSPQFVAWLVPIAVLARPDRRALALWIAAECWYFFAVWLHLARKSGGPHVGIDDGVYFTALWGRVFAVMLLAALVVRDILRARTVDDPNDGGFAGAPDRVTLGRRPWRRCRGAA
jgi:uncharacterized membrane protein